MNRINTNKRAAKLAIFLFFTFLSLTTVAQNKEIRDIKKFFKKEEVQGTAVRHWKEIQNKMLEDQKYFKKFSESGCGLRLPAAYPLRG